MRNIRILAIKASYIHIKYIFIYINKREYKSAMLKQERQTSMPALNIWSCSLKIRKRMFMLLTALTERFGLGQLNPKSHCNSY